METQNQQQGKFGKWAKKSITARMIMVGFLILILMIPLSYIKMLIQERMMRQQEVVSEINQKWGEEVLIYGPILKVPYKTYKTKSRYNEKTKVWEKEELENTHYAYFFPEELNISSTINPEEKTRGIYKTAVYQSDIKINGNFKKPDFSEKEIKDEYILWDKIRLIVQTSNLKGASSLFKIHINNNTYAFKSSHFNEDYNTNKYKAYNSITLNELESKILKIEDGPKTKQTSFSMDIHMKGSDVLRHRLVRKIIDRYQKHEENPNT